MTESKDPRQAPVRHSLRARARELPFEERPTEIPPDSPRVLDAMERAARMLEDDPPPAR